MSVELVTESTPEVVEAMGRLIPQLSRSAPPLDAAGARRFLSQGCVHLFVWHIRPQRLQAQLAAGP